MNLEVGRFLAGISYKFHFMPVLSFRVRQEEVAWIEAKHWKSIEQLVDVFAFSLGKFHPSMTERNIKQLHFTVADKQIRRCSSVKYQPKSISSGDRQWYLWLASYLPCIRGSVSVENEKEVSPVILLCLFKKRKQSIHCFRSFSFCLNVTCYKCYQPCSSSLARGLIDGLVGVDVAHTGNIKTWCLYQKSEKAQLHIINAKTASTRNKKYIIISVSMNLK